MTDDFGPQTSRVFKIVPAEAWTKAQSLGFYSGSADDLRDGFIHLSTSAQVLGTLQKYFIGQPDLLVVAFDKVTLAPHLKWEPSRGGDMFPHYYGPLPVKLALWQKTLPLGAGGIPVFDKDTL